MDHPSPALRIGDFRVEPSLNRVGRGGDDVRVTPKAMQVLMRLVERPGQVVGRDELLDAVWGDTFVNDDVLTRSIADLRKVFGDRPSKPRFIETIPKTGYRLVAPVDPVADASPPTVTLAEDVAPSPRPSRRRRAPTRPLRRWVWGMAAAALVAGAAVALRFSTLAIRDDPPAVEGRMDSTRTPAGPWQAVPVTSYPGREAYPRVSPDGRQLAFAWSGEDNDNWDVYVRMLDHDGRLRLTEGPEPELCPAWSPDGSRIAFMRFADDSCSIYAVSALGGGETKLGSCGRNAVGDLAWSRDGRWLAFSDRDSEEDSFGIFLLSPQTGERRLLVAPDGQHWGDRDPAFSPDGRWVSFTRSTSMATQDLYRVGVETGEVLRLTHDARAVSGSAWTSDGRHVVFVSERGDSPALWRVGATGGDPEWLPVAAERPHKPAVSPRGDVVYSDWEYVSDIYRSDLTAADPRPEPWITSSREELAPRFAPDGRRVAFVSRRSGSSEIWVGDGEKQIRLTSFEGPWTYGPRFSPDGRRVAFDSRPEGHADVYVVDAEGGVARRLTSEPSNELDPCWSADGAWIYFGSNRTGRWQIWRIPAAGGEAVAMTSEGGYAPMEHGGWLWYTKYDQRGLFRRPLGGGEESRVPGTEEIGRWGQASLRDEGLYVLRGKGEQRWVGLLDPETGQVRRVAAFPGLANGGFSVSPGGRYLVSVEIVRSESDLMLARR